MDTRFKDQGYGVTLVEAAYGAFLTITKGDHKVGVVEVTFQKGLGATPVVTVKRFRPNELGEVTAIVEE